MKKISAPLDCLMPVQALWSQFLPNLCYKQIFPTYLQLYSLIFSLYTLFPFFYCISTLPFISCSREVQLWDHNFAWSALCCMCKWHILVWAIKGRKTVIEKPPQAINICKEMGRPMKNLKRLVSDWSEVFRLECQQVRVVQVWWCHPVVPASNFTEPGR